MPEPEITLQLLGWVPALQRDFEQHRQQGLLPGRIAVEDKHFYLVLSAQGELTGQVSGKLLHSSRGPGELPKVGDWVALSSVPNEAKAIIHAVLPRKTRLSRKVAGREVEEQVLATNVDKVFAVQALDETFRPGLLHRHLVMILESGAKPVVVLNKADLCQDIPEMFQRAQEIAGGAPVIAVSAKTGQDIAQLRDWIHPGETVVFIGASGVGKSTLINDLYGEEIQATADVRESDAKGRHTTTWRELILLPGGGLVIDTPGMREFQMWIADEGLRDAFSDLDALAGQCRFRDCTHMVETGCAVLQAVAAGQLSQERYRNYVKLKKELAFLEQAHTKHSWMQRKRHSRVAHRGGK
jgi:ribosome biogenesis GTPase